MTPRSISAQTRGELVDFGRGQGLELRLVDRRGVGAVQPLGNHLQSAVVELGRGLHTHVFAVVKTAVHLVIGVP